MAWMVRITNIIVLLLGLAITGIGIALVVKGASISLSGAALALGLIDATMALLMVTCGHSRLFFLRLYTLILGMLEIAQAVICGLFLSPSYQQRIIDDLSGSSDLQSWVQSNLNVAGYFFLTVVAFQALALLLVVIQCYSLDKGFDDSAWDSGKSGAKGAGKSGGRDDSYAALRDEGQMEAATSRSRDKYGAFYEKYGLGGKSRA